MSRIIIITGTDTGVGKTVLTAALARHLHRRGDSVAALKPVCSGGRDDARLLRRALHDTLTLDAINPWHFRAPLTPLLAARLEGRSLKLREVLACVRAVARKFDTVLVEGAGGLLSPLGEDFSTLELIRKLRAEVMIVARNRLGVVNHLRLTLAALPPVQAVSAQVVLMSPRRADAASRSNPALLSELLTVKKILVCPWLSAEERRAGRPGAKLRRVLESLAE